MIKTFSYPERATHLATESDADTRLAHWDKMAAILQTTFANVFPWIKIMNFDKISLAFVPESLINNIPALVQIMAWRRQKGDNPLPDAMLMCCTDAYMRHSASMG